MKGYEFIPNSKSSLYVPSKFVTSGNVSDDTKLGIDQYKQVTDAYAEKDYSNFNMMKDPWAIFNDPFFSSREKSWYFDAVNAQKSWDITKVIIMSKIFSIY